MHVRRLASHLTMAAILSLSAGRDAAAAEQLSSATELSLGDQLEYSVALLPKLNGTWLFDGLLGFRFTPSLSSKAHVLHETFATEDEITGLPGSTRSETSGNTIVDLYALEYRARLFHDRLSTSLGLSFALHLMTSDEQGTFDLNDGQGPQQSNSQYSALFYAPKVELKNNFKDPDWHFAVSHAIEYVPIFYYTFDQTMSVLPLVPSGAVQNEYSDVCYPYLKNTVTVTWYYLEAHAVHEYQGYNFKLLNF